MHLVTRRIAAFVLGICLVGAGIGVVAQQPAAGPQKLKDLLKKKADVARQDFEGRKRRVYDAGGSDVATLVLPAMRLLEAELAMSEGRAERVAACEAHLGRVREIEQRTVGMVKAALIAPVERLTAEYYRLDAEIRLEQEKAK